MPWDPCARGLHGAPATHRSPTSTGWHGGLRHELDVTRLAPLARPLAALLDRLLPRSCLGCSRSCAAPLELGLCPACHSRIEAFDPLAACRGCLRPLPRETWGEPPVCGGCRQDPPPWAWARAYGSYRPPLDAVVRAFKYRGLDYLGPALARAALDALPRGDLGALDLVVPMPLPWTRRWTRGYNQAERLARPLARALGVPCREALRRSALAPRLARRSRAERARLALASLRLPSRRTVAGRTLLLVDDVFTTGATARAAATLLHRAGAARVMLLVAAWTPLDHPSHLA